MAEPPKPPLGRTYNGKVAALIVVAVVAVFVLLNLVSGRFVPQPDRPVVPPTVTVRPTAK